MEKKSKKPLHFGYYFGPVLFFVLVGLIDSIYLSFSHYKIYTDIWYQSFCAITKAINCDTVSLSNFAIFANVPVPVWGVLGYAFVLILIISGFPKIGQKPRLWSLIFLISILFCLYSVILALISNYYLHSYCILCILSYIVNFFLCFYCFIILRRFYNQNYFKILVEDLRYAYRKKTASLLIVAATIIIISCLLINFPRYWNFEIKKSTVDLSEGVTEQGYPWIGAVDPEIEIIMFSDYQCFQCKKIHFFLRNMLNEFPEKLRLIHVNFPIDHKVNPIVKDQFHVGSGALALMTKYAIEQNLFWEMNDYFFHMKKNNNTINIKEVAIHLGLDAKGLAGSIHNKAYLLSLKNEIRYAIGRSVIGTPSFLVNNELYASTLPKEVFIFLQKTTKGK